MVRRNDEHAGRVQLIQQIWEKTYWIFGLLFLIFNFWFWQRYGEWNLVRLYAAVLAVLGAGILVYALRARRMAEESRHWLPVRATIVRSEVTQEESRTMDSDSRMGPQYMVYYYPEIEYEYEVQGRTYHSNRLIAVQVNFSRADAEAWVAKYPGGAVVTARRHPDKPELAVLQPGLEGFESRYRIPFVVGGVFLSLGAVAWLLISRLT